MALLTTISSVNEVLLSSRPRFYEKSTLSGVAKKRLRTTRNVEYRFLTQSAAEGFSSALDTAIEGEIKSDGAQTSPTLHVDGFDNATGFIYPGTVVLIEGDSAPYFVSELATIASNEVDLVLTENFLEPGTILVNGASQTGTSLAIDGFTNENGKVREGTKLVISGDATVYAVDAQATIAGNAATVVLDQALAGSPANDTAVTLTHPAADDTPVTLGTEGVSSVVQRSGESGAYSLGIETDYFPNGTEWENA